MIVMLSFYEAIHWTMPFKLTVCIGLSFGKLLDPFGRAWEWIAARAFQVTLAAGVRMMTRMNTKGNIISVSCVVDASDTNNQPTTAEIRTQPAKSMLRAQKSAHTLHISFWSLGGPTFMERTYLFCRIVGTKLECVS